MPRKYKKNFMRKKRRPTKKKVLMRKDVLVNRGPVFMPDTFYTTLTYCQTVDLGTGTAVSPICTRYTFSGNSIFDPNDEDIGQYPLGYNEMRSIYKEFNVR